MNSYNYTLNDIKTDGSLQGTQSALILMSSVWRHNDEGTISIKFDTVDKNGDYIVNSYVGTNSKGKEPSMNLGFVDPPYIDFEYNGKTYYVPEFTYRNYTNKDGSPIKGWKPGRAVLHEFLHALGALHEHTNNRPFELIPYEIFKSDSFCGPSFPKECADNRGGICREYENCKQLAYDNVINEYNCYEYDDEILKCHSEYDSDSIMNYMLPDNWVNGPNPTNKPIFELSDNDREWLMNVYPVDAYEQPTIHIKYLNGDSWQHAWVKKIIEDKIAPFVGIQFIWPDIGDPNPEYKNTVNKEARAEAEDKLYNDLLIGLGTVAGILIAAFIIYKIFRYIYR